MFIQSFLKDHLLFLWKQPYCSITGIANKRYHFIRSPPGHLTYDIEVYQEHHLPPLCSLANWWAACGPCPHQVQFSGTSSWMVGMHPELQKDISVFNWTSRLELAMSGLLGIQQQQLGVGSKRLAHLIEEDFAWKSSKFSFPEHFTTRHGFHSKKTFAEKNEQHPHFHIRAFALILVSVSSLLQAQIPSVVWLLQNLWSPGAGPLILSFLEKQYRNMYVSFSSAF